MFNLQTIIQKKLPRSMRPVLLFAFGAFLLLSVPLFTQEDFNPESVQPKGCKYGKFNCGMNPMSQKNFNSIPEAKSAMISHRGLPSHIDWSSKMPPVGNQGRQGSCGAWATGYAMKSFMERVERDWGYDAPFRGGQGGHVFSPAYVYNQINRGRDKGSYLHEALQLMIDRGVAPWKNMPYTSKNYTRRPSAKAHKEAAKYKNKAYRRIRGSRTDAIRAELAKGNLIIFGIPVDQGFYSYRGGVYAARKGRTLGGHGMTLVGYDDSKKASNGHRGAFKMINSWGANWGDNGYAWISYRLWKSLNPQVYVGYDKKDSKNDNKNEPEKNQNETTSKFPVAPNNVVASKGTYKNKVVISWNKVNGVVAYTIGRALASNPGRYTYIGYAVRTSYTDTKVQPGIAYKYVILSVDEKRKFSKQESATAVEGYASSNNIKSKPDQVVGLDASESRSKVRLRWSKTSGASKYNIYRSNHIGTGMEKIATSRSANYIDRKPKSNSTNYYAVSAVNGLGVGRMSTTKSVSIGGKQTAPSRPTGVIASRGKYKTKVKIHWSRVTGASHYLIYRYDYSRSKWQGPRKTKKTKFIDSHRTIRSGSWFAYAVAAVNKAGRSKYSKYTAGRANPNAQRGGSPIDPPKNVRIKLNPKKQQMELRWNKVKGAQQYYVFRATKNGDYEFVTSLPSNKTMYKEKLPKKGEVYFYKLRSKVLLGESEDSKTVAAFSNKEIPMARHRAMPGAGFDKFSGTWGGFYWAGGSPINYSVEIKGSMGQFSAVVKEGGKKVKTIKGTFISNSSSIVAKDFKMELATDVDDTALLDFKSRKGQRNVGLSRNE